jgi:uncharacterized protein (TIGR02996 family)
MPDGVELLKEIAANPRDPCPRFVYADWLEESGSRDADWWRECAIPLNEAAWKEYLK